MTIQNLFRLWWKQISLRVPRWSFFSRVGNSKALRELARWFVFVPFIARLLATVTREVAQVPRLEFASHFSLPFDWQLLYYSAFAFMLAGITYEIGAPRIFRDFSSYFDLSQREREPRELMDYLLEVGDFRRRDRSAQKVVNDILSLADDPRSRANLDEKEASGEEVEQALHSAVFSGQERIVRHHIWMFCNRSRPVARTLCCALYFVGFLFLALAFASDLHAVFDQSARTRLVNHIKEVVGLSSTEKQEEIRRIHGAGGALGPSVSSTKPKSPGSRRQERSRGEEALRRSNAVPPPRATPGAIPRASAVSSPPSVPLRGPGAQ